MKSSATPILLVLSGLLACNVPKPVAKHTAASGDLAIVGAVVVPMDREGTLAGQTVLVRGDRIVAVAPAAEVDTKAATIVDGRGKWLLPGLADMHVHAQTEADSALFLISGVTTVRNLFGFPEHVRWRDAIARGELDGPTLITAGPIVDGDPPFWPGSAVVTTPEAARTEVQAQKKAGYDWIKVYNGLSLEVYEAVLDEAKRVGLPVAGHVPRAVGIDKALAGGQRSIEHLDGYVPFVGEAKPDSAQVAATVRAGTWNCPTLIVNQRFGGLDHPEAFDSTPGLELVSPIVRESWNPQNDSRLKRVTPEMFAAMRTKNELRRKLVGELTRAGAKLVLGTDTGNPFVVPGFAVAEELKLLVGAGLTPWQALRTATAAAAELLGTPGAFGVVAAGARADLILIDRDPLADVGHVADPPVIIVRGKLSRRAERLAAFRASQKAPEGDPFAKLPALTPEGKPIVEAHYDVLFGKNVIGGERAVLSRAESGTPVVRGLVAYWTMQQVAQSYRATRDSLEMTSDRHAGGIKASRAGDKMIATQGDKAPVELAAAADAVLAPPQSVAEFFWYAEILADLKVGAARTINAVAVRTDAGVALEPASYTFTRREDAEGRRVFDMTGRYGRFDLTGSFVVDADGAPHEISAALAFGSKFVTRRTK